MAKTTSKSKQDFYARYKASTKWKANRERKLLSQLKAQPGNQEQIMAAMKAIKYRRRNPEVRMWSSSNRKAAQLLREFSGSAKHACFSSNAKTAEEAIMSTWRTHNANSMPPGKVDFSIAARLQGNHK